MTADDGSPVPVAGASTGSDSSPASAGGSATAGAQWSVSGSAAGRAMQMMLSQSGGGAAPNAGAGRNDTALAGGTVSTADAQQDDGAPGNAELLRLAWLSGAAASAGGAVAASGAGDTGGSVSTGTGTSSGVSDGSQAAALNGAPTADLAQSAGAALPQLAVPSRAEAPAGTTTAQLQAPVGTSGWVEELGTQLTWMAHRGIESASLHVSPAELGPIEARISLSDSSATVWFGAAQEPTRAALEQALPQLHQLFASHGLSLADASVSREPPRQSQGQAPAPAAALIGAPREESERTAGPRASARLGLLDLYA